MRKVTADEVQKRSNADGSHMTVVDSRSVEAWNNSDIMAAGAIRIPPDDAEKHIADVRRDDFVIVYCT